MFFCVIQLIIILSVVIVKFTKTSFWNLNPAEVVKKTVALVLTKLLKFYLLPLVQKFKLFQLLLIKNVTISIDKR